MIKDGYIEKALIYLDKYPELVLSTLVNCTFHEIVDVMILLNGIFNYLHYENCLIIVNNLAYKGYSKEIIQCGILNEFAAIMEEYP